MKPHSFTSLVNTTKLNVTIYKALKPPIWRVRSKPNAAPKEDLVEIPCESFSEATRLTAELRLKYALTTAGASDEVISRWIAKLNETSMEWRECLRSALDESGIKLNTARIPLRFTRRAS